MNKKKDADCCAEDEFAPALKVADALERILAEVQVVSGNENLAVRSALGRVLVDDVVSAIDVPGHTNSAMDGYALRSADAPGDAPVSLRVTQRIMRGRK